MLPAPLRRARTLLCVVSLLGCCAFVLLAVSPESVESSGHRSDELGAVGLVLMGLGAIGLLRERRWGYWPALASLLLLPAELSGPSGNPLVIPMDVALAWWLLQPASRGYVQRRRVSAAE